jgi:hypothetical protein
MTLAPKLLLGSHIAPPGIEMTNLRNWFRDFSSVISGVVF